MTVQFSRSVRSIQADNLVPVLVGISFFAVLMFGWTLWLFFAKLPFYETSTQATLVPEGYVLAEFPAAALPRIRRGQPAHMQLTDVNRKATSIPLIAADIDPVKGEVRLILQDDLADDPNEVSSLRAGATGQVKVTVNEVSPLVFILRAAGLWPDG
ncbi:MAG: hypothetical protein NT075_01725 [Chloroflexi bacterium]|nr:hypothetical protein [Chloroflexota bacterium]